MEPMNIVFYSIAAVASVAALLVILQRNPVHALLYLIVSFLAVAVLFYLLGAPFAAALEVIIYAGAIIVLFVFVVMMLNAGRARGRLFPPGTLPGPLILVAVLLAEFSYVLAAGGGQPAAGGPVEAGAVAESLFGPYLLGVELASLLLLSGLVGAHHLGRRLDKRRRPGGGQR
jgi:NADH-quinone oxidoreductase subunit J